MGLAQRPIACQLALPDAGAALDRLLNEETSLTSCRIIQECLTNVARRSKAHQVDVALDLDLADEAAPHLTIAIEDDGIGLAPNFQFGFGFLGMSERVANWRKGTMSAKGLAAER